MNNSLNFRPLHQSRSKDFNQTGKTDGEKFGQNFGFGLQSQFEFCFLKKIIRIQRGIQYQMISL